MADSQLRKISLMSLNLIQASAASDIGVAVDKGVVSLGGHVNSYAAKTRSHSRGPSRQGRIRHRGEYRGASSLPKRDVGRSGRQTSSGYFELGRSDPAKCGRWCDRHDLMRHKVFYLHR